MQNVEGKVAFITGGASGIGFGMVQVFLENGMKIVLADNNQDYLDEAAQILKGTNSVHFMQLDVADRADWVRAADEAEAVFGKVHVLCNNAGVSGGGSVDSPDYDEWDWMMSVNLGGVVNGIKTFVPRIRAHGEGGHIVNTASMAGIIPVPGDSGGYVTAKFAVRGLSGSLRLTLAPDNIGVSVACPGLVRSRILHSRTLRRVAQGLEPDRPEAAKETAMGGMDPIEMAEAVMLGIKRNDPYIFAHPEFKDEVQELCDEMVDLFPEAREIEPGRLVFEERRRARKRELESYIKRG